MLKANALAAQLWDQESSFQSLEKSCFISSSYLRIANYLLETTSLDIVTSCAVCGHVVLVLTFIFSLQSINELLQTSILSYLNWATNKSSIQLLSG